MNNGMASTMRRSAVVGLLLGVWADPALAQVGGKSGGDTYGFVFMMAGMVAIFYFLLWRPQQKQRRDRESMLGALKTGDRVVTSGGLHGTVTKIAEHTVTIRVADQVRLEFDRSAIGRIVPPASDKEAGG